MTSNGPTPYLKIATLAERLALLGVEASIQGDTKISTQVYDDFMRAARGLVGVLRQASTAADRRLAPAPVVKYHGDVGDAQGSGSKMGITIKSSYTEISELVGRFDRIAQQDLPDVAPEVWDRFDSAYTEFQEMIDDLRLAQSGASQTKADPTLTFVPPDTDDPSF